MSEQPTAEPEAESDLILRWLLAERTGPTRPRLPVHEVALLNMVAQSLASGDPSGAKDVAALLALAPNIISPGARPAPRLSDLDSPQFDVALLSHEQLYQFESICAVATGAASPLTSPRLEAGIALAGMLDADGERDVNFVFRAREYVVALLGGALTLDDLHPSHAQALTEARVGAAALAERVAHLERQISAGATPALPSNVTPIEAARRAAAGAPIVKHSAIDGRDAGSDYSYLGA